MKNSWWKNLLGSANTINNAKSTKSEIDELPGLSSEPTVAEPDYEVAHANGMLYIRTKDFMVAIRDVKMTMPPNDWQEKEFAIMSFTYDIHDGEEFIKSMGAEEFETMVGPWVAKELESN